MTETSSYPPVDQTQFMAEEPLLEDAPKYQPVVPVNPEGAPPAKKPFKLIIIGAAVVLGLLILLIMMAALARRPAPEETPEETEQEQSQVLRGPFEQKIRDLRTELKEGDPTTESLPFPPVDMKIRLEEE